MKRKEILIPLAILIVALAVLVGGLFYSSDHQLIQPREGETSTVVSASSSVSSLSSSSPVVSKEQNGALRTLLATNQTEMCNINGSSQAGSISGTIYFASGDLRADLNVKSKTNGTYPTYMIKNQNKIYLWSGNQGVAINWSDFMDTKQAASADINLDENVNYQCGTWKTDQSKFQLPPGVTFTTLSSS